MSDQDVSSRSSGTAERSRRGQSLVEFALLLPLLLVLFLGIADFGRVFQAGIVVEGAARNGAEIVAEEYRRNPPGGSLFDPAPLPANPDDYQPLHDLGALTVCQEMRPLANTTYDPATRECRINDGDPATFDWMPVILICIHDNADPLCDDPSFAATIPSPQCSALLEDIGPEMNGGAEESRYVEVRICYRFTTLVQVPFFDIGDVWLQKDRTFTVANYLEATPTPPPAPTAPPGTTFPTDSPTPSPSATPTESPTPSGAPSPTPSPVPTPSPEPTPCALPVASFTATPTSGTAPLTVNFLNTSTSGCAITSYLWDFGDGNASDVQNPTHIYEDSRPGAFTVTLTVSNQSGTGTPATEIITVTQ